MKAAAKRTKRLIISALAIPALALMALLPHPSEAAATGSGNGEHLFKATCAICHGADGGGDTATGKKMKIPDLRSAEVQQQSDAQLYEVIARGKGQMPGWEKRLGRDKINQVVAYLRELGKKQ